MQREVIWEIMRETGACRFTFWENEQWVSVWVLCMLLQHLCHLMAVRGCLAVKPNALHSRQHLVLHEPYPARMLLTNLQKPSL